MTPIKVERSQVGQLAVCIDSICTVALCLGQSGLGRLSSPPQLQSEQPIFYSELYLVVIELFEHEMTRKMRVAGYSHRSSGRIATPSPRGSPRDAPLIG